MRTIVAWNSRVNFGIGMVNIGIGMVNLNFGIGMVNFGIGMVNIGLGTATSRGWPEDNFFLLISLLRRLVVKLVEVELLFGTR